MRRFLFLCMALAGLAGADVSDGERIYREAGGYGCAVCHGQVGDGAGQAGGLIRGATLEQLNDSLLNNDPMKPLSTVLSDRDRLDLSLYLADLATRPLITARYENGAWTGQAEAWQAGERIDLVLYNATFDTITVDFPVFDAPVELFPLATETWQGELHRVADELPGLTLEAL